VTADSTVNMRQYTGTYGIRQASESVIDVEHTQQCLSASEDPDLSRFIARGGNLITYHGTTDGLIPFGNSVNYYRSLVAKLGQDNVSKASAAGPACRKAPESPSLIL
jgi:hypothetical protein